MPYSEGTLYFGGPDNGVQTDLLSDKLLAFQSKQSSVHSLVVCKHV
jgi:hypothetical protein